GERGDDHADCGRASGEADRDRALVNRATRNVVVLGGRPFTPLRLFRNGETGFWYDFSKTDRTWQESTGQTIADDDAEVVGLALEQSQWAGKTFAETLAGQSEMVV